MSDESLPKSEIILYQTEDGRTRVQCRFENETMWLTQALIAELFRDRRCTTVNDHLKGIFAEGELAEEATIRKLPNSSIGRRRQVSREIEHYNLRRHPRRRLPGAQPPRHAVPPVGDGALERVSGQGLHHGRRAAQESAGQGPDGLLRRAAGAHPRHPLLASGVSTRRCSIFTPPAWTTRRTRSMSQQFFATVQNKMHWAAHGHTAAEVFTERADAAQPFMGLQDARGPAASCAKKTWPSPRTTSREDELQTLNRIVNLYIEFAELQALERKVMTMRDWIDEAG